MLSVLHMKCDCSDPQPPNLGGTTTPTRAREHTNKGARANQQAPNNLEY